MREQELTQTPDRVGNRARSIATQTLACGFSLGNFMRSKLAVARTLVPHTCFPVLLLHYHHPTDAEAVGNHAKALGEERFAERHSHLSPLGKRLEHAVGLGLVLGVDG